MYRFEEPEDGMFTAYATLEPTLSDLMYALAADVDVAVDAVAAVPVAVVCEVGPTVVKGASG